MCNRIHCERGTQSIRRRRRGLFIIRHTHATHSVFHFHIIGYVLGSIIRQWAGLHRIILNFPCEDCVLVSLWLKVSHWHREQRTSYTDIGWDILFSSLSFSFSGRWTTSGGFTHLRGTSGKAWTDFGHTKWASGCSNWNESVGRGRNCVSRSPGFGKFCFLLALGQLGRISWCLSIPCHSDPFNLWCRLPLLTAYCFGANSY